jgi:hypothetical protein
MLRPDEVLVEYDVTTFEVTVKVDSADRATSTSTADNREPATLGGTGGAAERHRLIRASGYPAHSRLNGGYLSVSNGK